MSATKSLTSAFFLGDNVNIRVCKIPMSKLVDHLQSPEMRLFHSFFFFNDTATTELYTLSLHDALPISERAMVYYTAFPGLLPTSMAQDTVPMSDLGNLKALLESAASRMGPQTVLITHQAIYGWARAYLSTSAHLINYGYSNPLVGVEMANSDGYSNVLLIWWINGFGWHDQPYVPNGFAPEYQLGDLALYVFRN